MNKVSGERAAVRRASWWLGLMGLLLSLSLAGCGGGGSSSANQATTGTAAIGLTDAAGDFVTYTVDVTSIKLVRANGDVVQTLPMKTRVDFAQYADMSEFLTAATVPLGAYKQAIVTLDYSHAQIEVEGNDGSAIPVTQILDKNGNPVTTMQMTVNMDRTVPISMGLPRYMMLDFNLAASNTVTVNGSDASITVAPVLNISVDKDSGKLHRLRGPLKSVDVTNSSYEVYIRPYFRRMLKNTDTYGQFHVHTRDTTVFEINGQTYQGSAGLQTLAGLDPYTAVVAIGHLQFNPLRFEADEVHAGSSVPGGDKDVVKGSVVARTNDTASNQVTLTLRGATLIRSTGAVVFNDDVTVTLDPSTVVTRELSTDPETIADISVGQRLTVFGLLTNDSTGNMQFSGVDGYARMDLSRVTGTVNSMQTNPSELAMNLSSINGRKPAIYNFAGTPADPTNYKVDPVTLDTSGINSGASLQVRGFPVPFGKGPPDYTAQTLIQQ